ncbi:hypothetical protein Nepgr_029728 [Nepenthes gracilis]|uniref:Uncharacterized protein n=1 Tax=Nepenthes gracilis TaxID=150966 RepID=A0AAD3Y543_NEPGR|nr:hypothetical protein Nepgr_029728 [Nepenthes gracilis]
MSPEALDSVNGATEGSMHGQLHLDSSAGAPSSSRYMPPLLDFYGVLAESSQLSKAGSRLSMEIDADLVIFLYGMQSPLVGKTRSLCALQKQTPYDVIIACSEKGRLASTTCPLDMEDSVVLISTNFDLQLPIFAMEKDILVGRIGIIHSPNPDIAPFAMEKMLDVGVRQQPSASQNYTL